MDLFEKWPRRTINENNAGSFLHKMFQIGKEPGQESACIAVDQKMGLKAYTK